MSAPSNVVVHLVRAVTISVNGGSSLRETILGAGDIWKVSSESVGFDSDDKIALILQGVVRNERGKQGGEKTWTFPDFIGLSVRPASSLSL